MSNKRILITGGAGFIGSHLADHFLKEGNEVVVLDNFISGSRENIKHLLDNPNFELIEHDVSLPLETFNLKLDKLSAILHFASPASPNPDSEVSYMSHPIETLMANSVGTKNMLDLAQKNNCQIILASTSEVYGDPLVHPQTEDYWGNVSPNGPRSCYDESKRFMEAISFSYFREFGTMIKVIRIFNTYGDRMRLDEGRFIPTIVDCALGGKTFNMFGDGSATRSFCHIDDLVSGIIKMYERDVVGQVINLGNPEEFNLLEAIHVLETVTNKKLKIHQQEPLGDDPKRRKPDIEKAKKLLDWEPTVSFQEGIKRMYDSYTH